MFFDWFGKRIFVQRTDANIPQRANSASVGFPSLGVRNRFL